MGQPRALVLNQVIAGKVDVGEAARLLGVSERSVRRLRARVIAAGPQALVHGNVGRRPAHSLDPLARAPRGDPRDDAIRRLQRQPSGRAPRRA